MNRPDPKLERHLLGETPKHLAESTKRLIESPEGRAELERLRESDRQILSTAPPEAVAEAIRRKLGAPASAPRRRSLPSWSLAVALLVMFGIFIVPWGPGLHRGASGTTAHVHDSLRRDSAAKGGSPGFAGTDSAKPSPRVALDPVGEGLSDSQIDRIVASVLDSGEDEVRFKGSLNRLRIHRIQGGRDALPLHSGDTLRAGDLVQIGVIPGPRRYAAVFSIDGAGQVTRHLPESGDSAVECPESTPTSAPHSYLLDDAPEFEKFFLLESGKPFSLKSAETLVRHPDRSPKTIAVHHIRLVKAPGKP